MNAGFQTADYLVFGVYALIIIAIGLYVSRFSKEKSSSDYFLAGRSLSWWAIGASLIAANISAEQFIGMSGSGFRIGIGIAAYEWIAGRHTDSRGEIPAADHDRKADLHHAATA